MKAFARPSTTTTFSRQRSLWHTSVPANVSGRRSVAPDRVDRRAEVGDRSVVVPLELGDAHEQVLVGGPRRERWDRDVAGDELEHLDVAFGGQDARRTVEADAFECARRPWTAGVHGPTGRRTVSPTRTTRPRCRARRPGPARTVPSPQSRAARLGRCTRSRRGVATSATSRSSGMLSSHRSSPPGAGPICRTCHAPGTRRRGRVPPGADAVRRYLRRRRTPRRRGRSRDHQPEADPLPVEPEEERMTVSSIQ